MVCCYAVTELDGFVWWVACQQVSVVELGSAMSANGPHIFLCEEKHAGRLMYLCFLLGNLVGAIAEIGVLAITVLRFDGDTGDVHEMLVPVAFCNFFEGGAEMYATFFQVRQKQPVERQGRIVPLATRGGFSRTIVVCVKEFMGRGEGGVIIVFVHPGGEPVLAEFAGTGSAPALFSDEAQNRHENAEQQGKYCYYDQ